MEAQIHLPGATEVASQLADFEGARQTVEDFLLRGTHAVEVGNFEEALNVFSVALSIYPNHVRCYVARGFVYQEIGNLAKAVEDFWRAVELDKTNPLPRKHLSSALTAYGTKMMAAGRSSEAQNLFLKSVRIYPENREAVKYLQSLELSFVTSVEEANQTHAATSPALQKQFSQSAPGQAKAPIFIVPKLETALPPEHRQTPGAVMLPALWSEEQRRKNEYREMIDLGHMVHTPSGRNVQVPWYGRSPGKPPVAVVPGGASAPAPFDTSMAEFMSKFEDLETLWAHGANANVFAEMQAQNAPPGFEFVNPGGRAPPQRSDSGYSTMDDQFRQQHQAQQMEQWQLHQNQMDSGSSKFCHHKGESSFKEVVPRPSPVVVTSENQNFSPMQPLTVTVRSATASATPDEEDLLISPKTHFKPIQDGQGSLQSEKFNDGTSFSASTEIEDPATFVRDEGGAILRIVPEDSGSNCGSPKKYMVYRGPQQGEQWAGWREPQAEMEEGDEEQRKERNRQVNDQQMRQSANSSGGGMTEEEAGMIFCKKNGPGDAANFVPKFKVHCSKREKICQVDEESVKAETAAAGLHHQQLKPRLSNEQFVNDFFLTGAVGGGVPFMNDLISGGHAPRSGHGFPETYSGSGNEEMRSMMGKEPRVNQGATPRMYGNERVRQHSARGAQAMLFPLEFDDESPGKDHSAAREDDDDDLLLHDIHVLRELELKDDNPGGHEEGDESVIPQGAARSFDHRRGTMGQEDASLSFMGWDHSPHESHFPHSPYGADGGFYAEYMSEEYVAYSDGTGQDGVPVEYLDSDLYDSMFGMDMERSGFLSSSAGSQSSKHMRKRNHSGADQYFNRKQRFRGSNWAPWQRRSGSNGANMPGGSAASTPQFKERPCWFFLESSCKKEHDCKFSHDLASIPCRFYEEGSCLKGELCPFRHGPATDEPPMQTMAHSFHFGTSPGSSLSTQFQKWRAQKQTQDGNARSLNDQRQKHKFFQQNFHGKGGGKRQRHGSATAAMQHEAGYVLREADFPALNTDAKDGKDAETGKQRRKKKKENARHRRGNNGQNQNNQHEMRHSTSFRQDDSGFSRDASDSPNEHETEQPSSGDEFHHFRQPVASSFPPRNGMAPICKFFLPRRTVASPPKVQEVEEEQPDGFLDLNAALLSFIDAPDAVENDQGLNFTAGVLAAGSST